MASPAPLQLLPTYSNEPFLETPNFDNSVADADFNYFEPFNSTTNPLFGLDGGDYGTPNWSNEQVVDPVLTNGTTDFVPGLDFGSGGLTPPPSAVERPANHGWTGSKTASAPGRKGQKLPTIDTASESNQHFASRHGQITPPMSSKSPESDGLETAASQSTISGSSKRGRKPSAKAVAAAAVVKKESVFAPPTASTPPAKSTRAKARKAKNVTAPVVELAMVDAFEPMHEPLQQEEEPQTEEAKAKRARFLERNRQAAFTCRQRKKQWAKDLEDRHRTLERENQNLKLVLGSLKDEYQYLRQQVVRHTTCECTGAREYIHRSSRVLAGDGNTAAGPALASRMAASGPPSAERQLSLGPNNSAAIPAVGLEQALRASLMQYEREHAHDPRLKVTDPQSYGGLELDGMTL